MMQVDMVSQRAALRVAMLKIRRFLRMEASAKFAGKRPVILVVPSNPTLTYLSQGRMNTGVSAYFSAD
jgi:hypothetical protein